MPTNSITPQQTKRANAYITVAQRKRFASIFHQLHYPHATQHLVSLPGLLPAGWVPDRYLNLTALLFDDMARVTLRLLICFPGAVAFPIEQNGRYDAF